MPHVMAVGPRVGEVDTLFLFFFDIAMCVWLMPPRTLLCPVPLDVRSALAIQRVFRGWRVRHVLGALKEASHVYFHTCATRIAAVWRGCCARFLYQTMRIVARESEEREQRLAGQ